MKNAKVESKKNHKAVKRRRVAGVQIRSGVKAGWGFVNPPGPIGGGRGGEPGIGR